MRFQPRQPRFLCVSSLTQSWLQTNCPGFTDEIECYLNFPDTELAGRSRLNAMLEKYHELQLKPLRQVMSWKWPCRPSGKSCHKNTSKGCWRTSSSAWLPAVSASGGHFEYTVCSNSVHLQVCNSASLSHHQQTGSFQSLQQITAEDYARNAENWRLSSLKLHHCVILIYFN